MLVGAVQFCEVIWLTNLAFCYLFFELKHGGYGGSQGARPNDLNMYFFRIHPFPRKLVVVKVPVCMRWLMLFGLPYPFSSI